MEERACRRALEVASNRRCVRCQPGPQWSWWACEHDVLLLEEPALLCKQFGVSVRYELGRRPVSGVSDRRPQASPGGPEACPARPVGWTARAMPTSPALNRPATTWLWEGEPACSLYRLHPACTNCPLQAPVAAAASAERLVASQAEPRRNLDTLLPLTAHQDKRTVLAPGSESHLGSSPFGPHDSD